MRSSRFIVLCLWLTANPAAQTAFGGGVTIITHGYNSDANGWVAGMAEAIPLYSTSPGTNFTIYKVTLTTDGTSYYYQWERDAGTAPSNTDTGEIIVKLDWSQMSGGSNPYDISTYTVAAVAASVILPTNSISDLNGHSLVEYPIHLVGHSRGGSLMAELSRILGTNGVWVDQLTSLDPYPFNNDGNNDTFFFPTDASASHVAVNVLFSDDYWQDLGNGFTDPNGEPVVGAYTRQLTSLSGGYGLTHSDVHLWYHGTINLATPCSDTEASLTTNERSTWWVPAEEQGTNTGFLYSVIGGGNRLGTNRPLGAGFPAIVDGYNQYWNLGAGTLANRTPLGTNTGLWPSLIKFQRANTNTVVQGQSLLAQLYYQWARPATSNATISFYLDSDLNPYDGNQQFLQQLSAPATGGNDVGYATPMLQLTTSNASPGAHYLLAEISAGGLARFMYAPQVVIVESAPVLGAFRAGANSLAIGVSGAVGHTVVLQGSLDLATWQPLVTNTMSTNVWWYTNYSVGSASQLFYRTEVAN